MYMSIPLTLALASTNGQSKKSPLYVAMTVGLSIFDVFEKSLEDGSLIGLIEDHEWPVVLWFWRVLEVVDVLGDNLSIRDEESLPINHVRNHHDLVKCGVGEFQWQFCGFDIEGQDDRVCTLKSFFYAGQ